MRIIKQGDFYKIQKRGWFGWYIWQYEDVGWYGDATYEDWQFKTEESARQFIKDWYKDEEPIEIVAYL